MPFPFVLPTTSAFPFSLSFGCDSHPSLPLNASTQRALVRNTLRKHKRLEPAAQTSNLPVVVSCLAGYLPYVLALDLGLHGKSLHGQDVRAAVRAPPAVKWRSMLVSGREIRRVRIADLDHEIAFVLLALAAASTLLARAALHPLHTTTSAPVGTQQRQAAIAAATRHLLDAASVYGHLALRAEDSQRRQQQQQRQDPFPPPPPCADLAPATVRGLRSLALAEATLLAVLKDDPYPAIVAQDRNKNDSEWMYKPPDVPKVRAHLFARLCLAAADHAAQALAGAQDGGLKTGDALIRYLEDLRRTGRAKACRFFAIDAELGGQTGTGIAWLRAGLQELGMAPSKARDPAGEGSSSSSGGGGGGRGLSRLKKEWTERREDRRVEKGASNWGADAGRLEEMRVIEMLEAKWTKQNDTIMTQTIPPTGPLLAQMPSGRDIHTIPLYQPPMLEPAVLEAMRAPPGQSDDDVGEQLSSDEDTLAEPEPPGTYPGTWQQGEARSGTPAYY